MGLSKKYDGKGGKVVPFLRLALVQMDTKLGAVRDNREHALEFFWEAGKQGADLVCFPELFTTGYNPRLLGPDYRRLAEEVPGPTTEQFSRLARELHSWAVLPMATRGKEPGTIYNSAVIISARGAIEGVFNKVHLPAAERPYFTPGTNYPVFATEYGKIAVMICYDASFPEVARILALQGAELVLAPAAYAAQYRDEWDLVFRIRALENSFLAAGINRVGQEEELEFFGNNKLAGFDGRILAEGPFGEEHILLADVNLEEVRHHRNSKTAYIKDRAVQTYYPMWQLPGDSGDSVG